MIFGQSRFSAPPAFMQRQIDPQQQILEAMTALGSLAKTSPMNMPAYTGEGDKYGWLDAAMQLGDYMGAANGQQPSTWGWLGEQADNWSTQPSSNPNFATRGDEFATNNSLGNALARFNYYWNN